jgi:hypothetical protein
MRNWIIGEVERGGSHYAGDDADVFDAEKQENGPNEHKEFGGEDEKAKRRSRSELFCSECDAEVTDEHGCARRVITAGVCEIKMKKDRGLADVVC